MSPLYRTVAVIEWRGKNGIDKIAFQYWFGEYDELEKFWKQ